MQRWVRLQEAKREDKLRKEAEREAAKIKREAAAKEREEKARMTRSGIYRSASKDKTRSQLRKAAAGWTEAAAGSSLIDTGASSTAGMDSYNFTKSDFSMQPSVLMAAAWRAAPLLVAAQNRRGH